MIEPGIFLIAVSVREQPNHLVGPVLHICTVMPRLLNYHYTLHAHSSFSVASSFYFCHFNLRPLFSSPRSIAEVNLMAVRIKCLSYRTHIHVVLCFTLHHHIHQLKCTVLRSVYEYGKTRLLDGYIKQYIKYKLQKCSNPNSRLCLEKLVAAYSTLIPILNTWCSCKLVD